MEEKVDIVALGELLIDFTEAGHSQGGRKLFEQNPGGAPANLLTVASHFGYRTSFIGKVGNDMHGKFFKEDTSNGRNQYRCYRRRSGLFYNTGICGNR